MNAAALLSEEQLQFRKDVRSFVEAELESGVERMEERDEFPWWAVSKIRDEGYFSVPFEEKLGGAGRGILEAAIVEEEICRASLTFGSLIGPTYFIGHPISKHGTTAQKDRFLRPLLAGEVLASIAITEPNAGSDVAGIETTAKEVDDGFEITGKKKFITNFDVSGVVLVLAKSQKLVGGERPHKAISAWIVEGEKWRDGKRPGLEFGSRLQTMGRRASRVGELILKDLRVPRENLLGREGEGFVPILASELAAERVLFAAELIGVATKALELAIERAKERKQFGKPISEFQLPQSMITSMAVELEASRLLTYQAALMLDGGEDAALEASMAKCYAGEAVVRICDRALQLWGGDGYTTTYPLERLLRDARMGPIGGGTTQILESYIARLILKRRSTRTEPE